MCCIDSICQSWSSVRMKRMLGFLFANTAVGIMPRRARSNFDAMVRSIVTYKLERHQNLTESL